MVGLLFGSDLFREGTELTRNMCIACWLDGWVGSLDEEGESFQAQCVVGICGSSYECANRTLNRKGLTDVVPTAKSVGGSEEDRCYSEPCLKLGTYTPKRESLCYECM